MEFGGMIGQAWRTTWRARYLWVLGLFAASSVGPWTMRGSGSGPRAEWRTSPAELERVVPGAASASERAAGWLFGHPWLVAAGVTLAVVAALAFFVVSLVAQGGMAEETVALARGQRGSLAHAWREGRRLFWRYLGLWALLAGAALLVALLFGALIAGFLVSMGVGLGWLSAGAAFGGGAGGRLVAFAVLLALAALALIPAGIILSIVVAFAQRVIAADDVGPLAALGRAWRIFRARIGESLLVWLVNLVLGAIAGVVVAAVAVLAFGAVAGTAFLTGALRDIAALSAGSIAAVVLAAAAAAGVAWLLAAVANTFFWNYWTLAYLRLRDAPNGGAAPAAV